MRRSALGLALVFLVAGCGDGSLTRDEYVARLDEACADYGREHDEIGEPESIHDLREKGPRIIAAFERLVDRVRALEPPDELADEARRVLEIGDRQLEVLRGLTEAARTGDAAKLEELVPENARLNEEATDLFRRIGATECAAA